MTKKYLRQGVVSAELMRVLWNKRVDESREIAIKAGVQFTRVSDFSPLVRRMSSLHSKYMADPHTRDELLTILATGAAQ